MGADMIEDLKHLHPFRTALKTLLHRMGATQNSFRNGQPNNRRRPALTIDGDHRGQYAA
jgi:hypothetical protein